MKAWKWARDFRGSGTVAKNMSISRDFPRPGGPHR